MGQLTSGAFDGSGTGVFPGGGGMRVVTCYYKFSIHGGAQSNITIGTLPKGTLVMGGFVDLVDPILGGGGCTCALTVEGAGDIKAATLLNASPWAAPAGRKEIVPKINEPENSAKDPLLTADRNIYFKPAVANVTAGEFYLHLIVENAV